MQVVYLCEVQAGQHCYCKHSAVRIKGEAQLPFRHFELLVIFRLILWLFFSHSVAQSARFLLYSEPKLTEYLPPPPSCGEHGFGLLSSVSFGKTSELLADLSTVNGSSPLSAVGLWRRRDVVVFWRSLPHLFARTAGGGSTVAVTVPNYPVLKK